MTQDDSFGIWADLNLEIEKWFFDNIEDGPYSEALHDLQRLIYTEIDDLREYTRDAEADQERLDAENQLLETQVKDMEQGLRDIVNMIDDEDGPEAIRNFIETSLLYGETETQKD